MPNEAEEDDVEYAIAVMDIGKTNKKLLVYDENLSLLDAKYETFPTFSHEGLEVEDVEGIERWFIAGLKEFSSSYPIQVISVTTHGATSVCVGEDGNPCLPVVSYTNEPGKEFHREFFEKVGSPAELQRETGTAEFMALLNVAQAIYFLKTRYPEGFAGVRHILNYPQYFGFKLTGNAGAEPTYIGCHSYLWDFRKDSWSRVADVLGIRDLLPEKIQPSWGVLGKLSEEIVRKTGLSADTIVTMGIHDSNSSLLPYLVKQREGGKDNPFAKDFILNSTGTWCVEMHPMKEVFFREDEIGKVVFYNRSAFSDPVKTSIFMGGQEFETYTDILKELHGSREFPAFDRELYQKIIDEKELFILPGVVPGTGQFPSSAPRVVEKGKVFGLQDIQRGTQVPEFFKDFRTAYAVLNLSLAIQTKVALERVGLEEGVSIFVEGGFRKNPDYNNLLADFFPKSPVGLTNIREATSFGAAILSKLALIEEGRARGPVEISIEYENVPGAGLKGTESYIQDFFSLL